MAITGTEWLILGAVVVLVIMFKPNSVTDLARSFGKVVNEFKKGKRGPENVGEQELLVDAAERLGIKTEGKSTRQISQDILTKAGHD